LGARELRDEDGRTVDLGVRPVVLVENPLQLAQQALRRPGLGECGRPDVAELRPGRLHRRPDVGTDRPRVVARPLPDPGAATSAAAEEGAFARPDPELESRPGILAGRAFEAC